MNITAKSRYALKIMLDLCLNADKGVQQRHEIALRQGISVDFMDHILSRLKSSRLIQSVRGRQGGYKLGKDSKDISLWDIFYSVEDQFYPVKCMEHLGCELKATCNSYDIWLDVFSSIENSLSQKRLYDLAEKWQRKSKELNIPLDELKPVVPNMCKGVKSEYSGNRTTVQ